MCNQITISSSLSEGVTMTGSASNITTQWTFRDGRDYVLSLTNTETPNTISFWISDKITGEEWTGCYDENCIEVLTKRTGCFKSFHIFLSMVKSAILKKSDSVILELLNIQDLAAISTHRQATTASTDSGITSPPLNFELYNSDVTVAAANRQQTKPQNEPYTETNANNSSNGKSGGNKPPSPLNKRKYLIVSYIGEFDKVHYPLPLNYSNPPDLNVMQNNIIKLKAEVTSLKRSKKELEHQLESVKLSGRLPEHSHENKDDVNFAIPLPYASNSSVLRKEPVILRQNLSNQVDFNGNDVEGSKADAITDAAAGGGGGGVDESKPTVSPTCIKCADTIETLLATICHLEKTIASQREEYFQNMEKLENENHFLRHKVDTSEKYELELWNKIQALKERVERKESLGKEKKMRIEAAKDTHKNRCRQSRHDLFYSTKHSGDAKPVRKLSSKSPSALYDKMTGQGQNRGRKYTQFNQRSRSNSNSTASYSSACGNSNENICKKDAQNNEKYRSLSSSSYRAINLSNRMAKSRSESISPARRFDPTAYVTEKKMKQSRIANMRMQKIESRIGKRTGSAGSTIGRPQSISPCKKSAHLTRTTLSPTTLCKLRTSLSGEILCADQSPKNQRHAVDTKKHSSKTYYKIMKDRAERNSYVTKSRPSSAESCRTKILPPAPRSAPRFSLGESWSERSKQGSKAERGDKILQNKPLRRYTHDSQNSPTVPTTELGDRILRSPAKKRNIETWPNTNSIAINTSFTCDQLDSIFPLSGNLKPKKLSDGRQNEKQDISYLQEKLSALNAFLETCKPKV